MSCAVNSKMNYELRSKFYGETVIIPLDLVVRPAPIISLLPITNHHTQQFGEASLADAMTLSTLPVNAECACIYIHGTAAELLAKSERS